MNSEIMRRFLESCYRIPAIRRPVEIEIGVTGAELRHRKNGDTGNTVEAYDNPILAEITDPMETWTDGRGVVHVIRQMSNARLLGAINWIVEHVDTWTDDEMYQRLLNMYHEARRRGLRIDMTL